MERIRRNYPLALLVVAMAATVVSPWFVAAIVGTSFLVGRRMAGVWPVLVTYALAAAGLAALPPVAAERDAGFAFVAWLVMVLTLVFVGVLPWLVGRYWRHYQALVHAGWERAERLEREQRILADRERLRERSRIAQDMHDSLGHELSLIGVRAGALEVAPDLGEHHRTAAGELRSAAGAATERLREIIGVLREEAEPARLDPAHESIAELVERATSSGMAVELRHEPEYGEVSAASPMADRAAHRVVQEALTNAAKHAPGAEVTVDLAGSEDETVVTVVNEASPDGVPVGGAAGNRGLIGLDERVRLAGGTLEAARRDDGGFEVVARLPRTTGPVPPAVSDVQRSESARHLDHARRRARRGLLVAVVAPVVLGATLVAAIMWWYGNHVRTSVLDPTEFARLQTGQTRAAAEQVLPSGKLVDLPIGGAPPEPAGAVCAYYRSDGNFYHFGNDFRVYQVCFEGGRLVSKKAFVPDAGAADDALAGAAQ